LVKESESVELREGTNVVTLASDSVFPHIEKVYFVKSSPHVASGRAH